MTSDRSEAGEAGRGALSMSVAKMVFVLLGFAVQFGLPRVLRSPSAYGELMVAMNLMNIVTNTMVTGIVQATSRDVAAHPGRSIRVHFVRHLGLGLVLGALFAMTAPLVASELLGDRAIAPLLMVAGVIVVSYALYATAIGGLNGARAFTAQARLDMTFSVVRTAGLLGGALAGASALSTMAGFASAAVAMAIVGTLTTGRALDARRGTSTTTLAVHLSGLLALSGFQLAVNGMLQGDLAIVKGWVARAAEAAGQTSAAAAELASHEAGLYRAAQAIAFVPYQLLLSVTFVLFPLVARATSIGDAEARRTTIGHALRFSWLALVVMAAPLAGAASGLVRFVFPASFADAGSALPILVVSQVGFALFVVAATALSGAGHERRAIAIGVGGLAIMAVAIVVGISTFPAAPRAAAAAGAALGAWSALAFVLRDVHRIFGATLRLATWLRGGLAWTLAVAAAHGVDVAMASLGRLAGIVAAVVGGLSVLALLAATREIGANEVALVRGIIDRRRARS